MPAAATAADPAVYVRHLSVVDFRSWVAAEVPFDPGPAVLVGPNGHGKTNLVEAIGYLATHASHRVATDAPLVRHGAAQAIARCAVVHAGRELLLELEINPGRSNRGRLNRAPVPRPRQMLGVLRTVLFAPEDLALVRGDPGDRRRFLDDLLVARNPRYAGVRADYERALRQRNSLLKSAAGLRRGAARARRGGAPPRAEGVPTQGTPTGEVPAGEPGRGGRAAPAELSTLDSWDLQLAGVGAQLLAGRLALLADLAPHLAWGYQEIASGARSTAATGQYVSSLGADFPAADLATADLTADRGSVEVILREALLAALARERPQELERGVTLVGPHRDEWELRIGELPAKGYASHGEAWSLALACRLAGYELLRADGGEPVLILDDVFAELDTARRGRLARIAAKAEQVLITAAVEDDVPVELHGARYTVREQEVRRVQ